MSLPGMDTISNWIFHPGTYEMTWWVLLCVVWYGFMIERRLKIIQVQLDAIADAKKLDDAPGRSGTIDR
jgi:hypothetical protein